MVLRFFHGGCGERPDAEAGMRRRMARARPVGALVEIDGALAAGAVAEEPGVAIGQAEQGGDLRAVVGAAEDGRMVVVLGDPEALVTQRLAVLGESHRVADRFFVRTAGYRNRLVEN